MKTPEAGAIGAVALIHPTATTHCVDTDQRHVELTFEASNSGTLFSAASENRNVAPPGYYMLFILRAGVPSEAAWVHLS